MNRITKRKVDGGEAYLSCELCGKKAFIACWSQENCTEAAVERLADIEDILGDEYDLEYLKAILGACMSISSECEALKKKLSDAERAIAALMQIEPQERITTCFGHPIGRVLELIEADKRREILIYPKKRERVPVILIQDEQSDFTQKQWEFLVSRFLKVR